MNLRPTDKSKHLAKSYFGLNGQTRAQRMQDDNLLYRNNILSNKDLGLPEINDKIAKMNQKLDKLGNKSPKIEIQDHSPL
jgi:hypothetical protein